MRVAVCGGSQCRASAASTLPRAASPQRAVSSRGQEHYGDHGPREIAARGLQREAAHLAFRARRSHLRGRTARSNPLCLRALTCALRASLRAITLKGKDSSQDSKWEKILTIGSVFFSLRTLRTYTLDHYFAVTNARLQNLLCSRLEGPQPLALLKDRQQTDNGNINFLILGAPQWLRVHGEPAGHAANLCSNLRQC